MTEFNFQVVIIALKKNVAFHDDLVKKLSGITLVQRAINKALELNVEKQKIHLITDSDEISMIAYRNEVSYYYDHSLVFSDIESIYKIFLKVKSASKNSDYLLFLSPYSPLISLNTIKDAFKSLAESSKSALQPFKEEIRTAHNVSNKKTIDFLFGNQKDSFFIDSKAFFIVKSKSLNKLDDIVDCISYPLSNDFYSINSYQDWWVCERLINRKRIVFRVIGNAKVGMGHIYRALSIAHEISNHEILFICDKESIVASEHFIERDYKVFVVEKNKIVQAIINLNPDLVINDILSSKKNDIKPLSDLGIKTVCFEDLGEGAKLSNLTINEIYDEPLFKSKNTYWGQEYFFLRDEFSDAKSNIFEKKISNILLSFGGTDQHNLTENIYKAIKSYCFKNDIVINIVCGPGYIHYDNLYNAVKNELNVKITRSTGVISKIMEDSQIAIVSNGRTVYELAHLNIPSIVISQHTRENTHSFASEQNGFISLGIYCKGITEKDVLKNLTFLINDNTYRKKMIDNMHKYDFSNNKTNVIEMILSTLEF